MQFAVNGDSKLLLSLNICQSKFCRISLVVNVGRRRSETAGWLVEGWFSEW